MGVKDYFAMLRPQQWYKNALIFIPLFFSNDILNPYLIALSLIGFVLLCAISSAGYILNDIKDFKEDRIHPKKKHRPIAAGRISKERGFIAAALLIVLSVYFSFGISPSFCGILVLLLALTLMYSMFLKRILLADAITIGIGFVLRALSGVFLLGLDISPWLILITFFLAVYLVFLKRKAEKEELKENSTMHRETLEKYSWSLLNGLTNACLALLLIAYFLYALLQQHRLMVLTIPIAAFSILRFNHLADSKLTFAMYPEKAFKDRQFMIGVSVWVIIVFFAVNQAFFFRL